MKNSLESLGGLTGTLIAKNIAKAVDDPDSATGPEEVSQGSVIKAIYVVMDICGLGASGVLNNYNGYLIKNGGANLTPPAPISVGTSNEKRWIIRQWHGMIMRNQDGNAPLHWEGWIKIPKRFQRMGTDDIWQIVMQCTSGVTGHFSLYIIYKWYS